MELIMAYRREGWPNALKKSFIIMTACILFELVFQKFDKIFDVLRFN